MIGSVALSVAVVAGAATMAVAAAGLAAVGVGGRPSTRPGWQAASSRIAAETRVARAILCIEGLLCVVLNKKSSPDSNQLGQDWASMASTWVLRSS